MSCPGEVSRQNDFILPHRLRNVEAIEDSRKDSRTGPPTPRERRTTLKKALVLAFIVVALLTVVIVQLPPRPHPGTPEPTLQFEQPVRIAGGWKIVVGEVSVLKSRGEYEVVLSKNGTVVETWMSGPFLYFYDMDHDGNLSAGDWFIAVCDPGSEYGLEITWRPAGILSGQVEWKT